MSQNDFVDIVFTSPSRPTLTFNKSLDDNGQGFFTFTLTATESEGFVDDTYTYEITKDSETLKLGNTRLV